MKFSPIAIKALGSVSPLGFQKEKVEEHYINNQHYFDQNLGYWSARVPYSHEEIFALLQYKNSIYFQLDRTVLLALLAVEQLANNNEYKLGSTGINIGSSRGATVLWEKYYKQFYETQKVDTLTSPTTSLGNISSWVAQHIGALGIHFEHSMTCSSSFFSIINAVAWLQSDMAESMIVGGSESSLTSFTIAQLKALRIYSQEKDKFPCKAGNIVKTRNTMVLGEGCALLALDKSSDAEYYLKSVGFSNENIKHSVYLSHEAENCQQAMRGALQDFHLSDIDAIVTHTPGTKQGDIAEIKAIQKVFGNHVPLCTNNKWKIGHTFGASGALSIELALLMLEKQIFIPTFQEKPFSTKLNTILINTLGFGGNAISIVVGK